MERAVPIWKLPNRFRIAQNHYHCPFAFYLIFDPFSYETSHLANLAFQSYYKDTKGVSPMYK